MQIGKLSDMKRGWFVGDFQPTMLATGNAEVAVKQYVAGEREDLHYHKVATEVTLVVSGEIEMAGRKLTAGQIVVLEPNEATAFLAVTDAVTVVVKIPGAKDDKYLGRP